MLLVAALVVGVGALVARSLWQQHRSDAAQRQTLEFLPGVSQHMQDFHRVKIQNGRKIWEFSARDAQYYDEDKTVVVRDASMQLFLKDGRDVGLKGEQAKILLDGREVLRVDLEGDIELSMGGYQVHTDRATYDHAQQTITAPGPVEIDGRALSLRGDRMHADVQSQTVELLDHVSMHFDPAVAKEGTGDAPL